MTSAGRPPFPPGWDAAKESNVRSVIESIEPLASRLETTGPQGHLPHCCRDGGGGAAVCSAAQCVAATG